MSNGLTTEERKTIAAVFAQVPAIERAVLFGSRAMGLGRGNSDVDIALYGDKLGLPDILHTASLLEETLLPYHFDLISRASITSPELLEHIRQYGKEMYRKERNTPTNSKTISAKEGEQSSIKRRLSDIVNIIGGGTPKTSIAEYWDGEIPWLSVKDFNNDDRYVYSTEKTITEAGLANSSTKLLDLDDIIISARGTVGEMAMIPFPMAFNQSCYGIRGKPSVVIQTYLYYLLKHSIPLLKRQTHGSVFDTITRDTFANIEVDLPPIKEQQIIAATLSSLDDKIENNRKINQCLEQMAQAIFKSWFVDFEPWGGVMPSDWREGTLGEYVAIKRGGSPRPIQDFLSDTGLRWLKISDVSALQTPFILEIKEHIKEAGLRKTVFIKSGALVLSNSATPGIPKILGVDTCIHDGWLYFPSSMLSNEYLYLFFKHIRKELISFGNGSVFTNLKTDILKNYSVNIPNEPTRRQFDDLITPLFRNMEICTRESLELSKLRDSLLPRLISGKLSVAEVLVAK